jgi:hypothetical protein
MRLAWLRDNADRVVLCTLGVALLVLAVLVQETPFAFLGLVVFVLGVFGRQLKAFSIGPKGLFAQLNPRGQQNAQKTDGPAIRNALANFVAAGDQLANALSVARQMVDADHRLQRDPSYDRTIWQQVGAWADNAENYIRATAALGEADAILFVSHGSGQPTRLKLPERFEGTIAFIRERQNRLRDLIKRFE